MLEVINRLHQHGHKAYLVGGSVRDRVMNQSSKDFDVFTTASLDTLKEIFKDAKIIEVQKDKPTLLIILKGVPTEVSTYRSEIKDIKHDLKLRDFTMNTLLYDGEIHDYLGALKDIDQKLIRMNDKERLVEDLLRILRALRFASTLGFRIEAETEAALFELKDYLKDVSVERIYKELKQILMGKDVFKVVMRYVDILSVLFPHLKQMENFNQHNPHHSFDLLTHSLKVVEHSPQDESIRLAAFFHDFGKLETMSFDEEGVGHFYGHDKISADIANQILKDLKADTQTKQEVIELVRLHGRDIHPTPKAVRRLVLNIEEEMFYKLMALKKADRLGKKDEAVSVDDLDEMLKIYETLKAQDKLLSLKTLKIKGQDLIDFGMKEGPKIGRVLNQLLEKCLNDELENEKEALLNAIKEMV